MQTRAAGCLAAALLVVGALSSGCGGGGEEGSSTATAANFDKAEFLERGNGACRKIRKGLAEEAADYRRRTAGSRPPQVLNADIAHYVILPEIEEELEALRALILRFAERERVDEILAVEQQELNEVVFMERLPSLEAARRQFAGSARMLRAYGLRDCANDPQA